MCSFKTVDFGVTIKYYCIVYYYCSLKCKCMYVYKKCTFYPANLRTSKGRPQDIVNYQCDVCGPHPLGVGDNASFDSSVWNYTFTFRIYKIPLFGTDDLKTYIGFDKNVFMFTNQLQLHWRDSNSSSISSNSSSSSRFTNLNSNIQLAFEKAF